MEEGEGAGLEVKELSLIDVSSETGNLVAASTSPITGVIRGWQNSENLQSPESYKLSGTTEGNKVNIFQTSGYGEDSSQLAEISEAQTARKTGKCNLRKSLAWDSAFFTNAGVLDPDELSTMIEGSKKFEKHLLPGIEEDIHKSTDSISSFESDNLTLESLEAELFEDIRASIQKSSKPSNITNSCTKPVSEETVIPQDICSLEKVDLAVQNNRKPKPALKQKTIDMQGSKKMIKQGSGNQQVKQSAARIGGSTSSLPKPIKTTGKPNPIPISTTKRASMSANHGKIESDKAKSITVGKVTQASKIPGLSGARKAVPKPALSSKSSSQISNASQPTRSSSSCESSSSAASVDNKKSPLISARRNIELKPVNLPSSGSVRKTPLRIASKSKTASGNSVLSAYLLSSKVASSISPASSISEWSSESSSSSTFNQKSDRSRASVDTCSSSRSLDNDGPGSVWKNRCNDQITDGLGRQLTVLHNQNINKGSAQVSTISQPASTKPSGLRMPSPKIGFFDGAKSMVHTPKGSIQPRSGLPAGLPKIGSQICSLNGRSNKQKVAKLPKAANASTNISEASMSAKHSPSLSPLGEKKLGGESGFKAEKGGNNAPNRIEHVLDSSAKAVVTNIQETVHLMKNIKIALPQGDNFDSSVKSISPDSSSKSINPSNRPGENSMDGNNYLKNDLNSLHKSSEKKNGHFEDQVNVLSENMEVKNSKLELQKEQSVGGGQKGSLTNLSDPSTVNRSAFAVKDSLCNTEEITLSNESNFEVSKTANVLSSEIDQKENNQQIT